ncbi:hypothetical protein [Bacillus tropicus]|uniref:hypothetical protein n=2 Tax=Bacillus tropicus TaxID=2026188 RepID=UPI0011206C6D|nr:hypothetical protein [Bacillus tropicus]MED2996960.1 hypothetical protein [Bacillus tropicus]
MIYTNMLSSHVKTPANVQKKQWSHKLQVLSYVDRKERVVCKMVYAELTSSFQKSFRSDLCKVLRYYLKDTNYACVTEDTWIVTDSFVDILMVYFQGSPVFLKWEKIGFELDRISWKKILQEIEHAMRQRSSTLKNRNHFYRLLREVGLQEDIPQDFLCMKKRLLELEMLKQQRETKRKERLVSARQIKSLQVLWKKTFHRTLEVSKDMTQGEVEDLFFRIHKKQCKLARMSKKSYSGNISKGF